MKYYLLIVLLLTGCAGKKIEAKHPELKKENIIILPDINYTYNHLLLEDEAQVAAEKLAKSLEKYGMKWKWDKSEIFFRIDKGLLYGVEGKLKLTHKSVSVEIYNLPFFVSKDFAKLKIKEKIYGYFQH